MSSAMDTSLDLGFLKDWEELDEANEQLLVEALELVEKDDVTSRAAERLREIFSNANNLDINMQLAPVYGETLLMQAVQREHVPVIKALLDLGADPLKENYMDGETPLGSLEQDSDDDGMMDEPRSDKQNEILGLLRAKVVPEKCAKCEKTNCKLLLCGKCRRVMYCSSTCQKKHWKASHKKECKNSNQDIGQQIWDAYKEKFWAIGQDPAEVEELQEQLRADPDNLIVSLTLSNLGRQLQEAMEQNSPENFAFCVMRNKRKHAARKAFDELDAGKRALLKEAFEILQITDDDELNYESPTKLVARIKEIYSTPGLDVNLQSATGSGLLQQVISCYYMDDDNPNNQLGLIRFLLEKGADPKIQDCIGETPLSVMDQINEEEDERTDQQKEIIRLLLEAGDTMPIRDD